MLPGTCLALQILRGEQNPISEYLARKNISLFSPSEYRLQQIRKNIQILEDLYIHFYCSTLRHRIPFHIPEFASTPRGYQGQSLHIKVAVLADVLKV